MNGAYDPAGIRILDGMEPVRRRMNVTVKLPGGEMELPLPGSAWQDLRRIFEAEPGLRYLTVELADGRRYGIEKRDDNASEIMSESLRRFLRRHPEVRSVHLSEVAGRPATPIGTAAAGRGER